MEKPRYAIVVWPYNRMGLVKLDGLDRAVKRGALVIAREDAELLGSDDSTEEKPDA